MKAVTQNYRSGDLAVRDLPAPALQAGQVLVRNAASLVSAGTERAMVNMAQKTLLEKAAERPDLVRQVLDKARRDGVMATIKTVQSRLDTPMPMGYSCAGTVIAVGDGVTGIKAGDRAACAGAGYASHAEIVAVPQNLVIVLPDPVGFEAGAFTTLGAVALQGVRLADVRLGETVAVLGLGLVGQLAVQILKAAGCAVIGLDVQQERAELAHRLGADHTTTSADTLRTSAAQHSGGNGVDAVLITAGTTSSELVALAGELARERGKVIMVGAAGMDLPRKPYYDKELIFRVSRSYGPGRYDPEYEEKGRDYPIGYVRWTENRNMQAFAQLIASGQIDTDSLTSHRFEIHDAVKAYDVITGKERESHLAVLLTYPQHDQYDQTCAIPSTEHQHLPAEIRAGVLGAGQFATGTLIPAMKKNDRIQLVGLCTAGGTSAEHGARKFGFRYATTDSYKILTDDTINTVVIATRHHLHAKQVMASLEHGKHVFCEKPLCITEQELTDIREVYDGLDAKPRLMVGYNRRYAPLSVRLKEFAAGTGAPLIIHYRVNAGTLPQGHWVNDPEQGGGRIIGEVCHFVDYLLYLTGSTPTSVKAVSLRGSRDDSMVATLEFPTGSIGTITYAANGDPAFPKECVEVFSGGRTAVLDNFRKLMLYENGRRRVIRAKGGQDKGHKAEWDVFAADGVGNDPFTAASVTFRIVESLHSGHQITTE